MGLVISLFVRESFAEFQKKKETKLLDLPDELLLLVAKNVDSVSRRRLSQTCRRLFYQIRERKNWKNFHIQTRVESIQVEDYGTWTFLVTDLPDVKRTVRSFAINPTYPVGKGVTRVDMKGDLHENTMSFLLEMTDYFIPEEIIFLANLKTFPLKFVENLYWYHPKVAIVITNEGVASGSEEVLCNLIKIFLKRKTPVLTGCLLNETGNMYILEQMDFKKTSLSEISQSTLRLYTALLALLAEVSPRTFYSGKMTTNKFERRIIMEPRENGNEHDLQLCEL